MNREQDREMPVIKGPEIRVKGPRSLDQLTVRLAAAGLIIYDAFRHPLTDGYIVMDFAKRTASLQWKRGGNNG